MEIKKKEFLNEYSWDEINYIAKNNLGRKYFKIWDFKILRGTNGTFYECRIIGFDHDDKSNESGKAGITFLIKDIKGIKAVYTSSPYKFFEYDYPNGISWIGSNIRRECLEKGQERFIYIEESEKDKEYYFYNTESGQFEITSKIKSIKLYKKEVISKNGKLYNLIPKDIMDNIVSVKKKTWTGYGGSVRGTHTARYDDTFITTDDKLWIPSASELFEDSERFRSVYYKQEGNTYNAFLKGNEERLKNEFKEEDWRPRHSLEYLRSPHLSSETSFTGWHRNGWSTRAGCYYDLIMAHIPLCFCL